MRARHLHALSPEVVLSAPAPHLLPSYRDYSHGELIADGVVHAMALVAGVIAFSVLFQKVAMYGAFGDGVAMAIYAAGFFFLFGFSCAYNMAPPSLAKAILRRFDHASIYLMIGGTYTALLSQARASLWVITLGACIWCAALAGAFVKLLLPGRFDRFSVRLYLALGWSAVIAVKPLVSALPLGTIAFVFAGGVIYSIGVAFYLWESLKFQNAIWHACVAVAAACQFAGVLQAVGR
jgi:hemolysin III